MTEQELSKKRLESISNSIYKIRNILKAYDYEARFLPWGLAERHWNEPFFYEREKGSGDFVRSSEDPLTIVYISSESKNLNDPIKDTLKALTVKDLYWIISILEKEFFSALDKYPN